MQSPGDLRGRVEWTGDTPPPWPVVHASWRDILSSVHWASGRSGFAVLEVVDRTETAREFHLLGIRGERGVVRVQASRTVENSLPSDPWITFDITLGAFGEDERRHALRADLLAYRPAHDR
ncbi:hypothetical protein [Pseudanabaena sp. CCNP1317]|uniref:hypothetical protein n=1 Tax=Pseudanabaena sp. CCNP1317 TaxID=3110253 RepID=UPI002B21A68A|nr:hypothetical protein [Pseudanabaena sp. CCNP1317]MEA5486599.1 hypothetical protein [Pseudanabaena sp. CCNP1317]